MSNNKYFAFNTEKARNTIFIFFASSLLLIFLIGITDNKITNNFGELREWLVAFFILYFFLILVFIRRLFFFYRGDNYEITLNGDVLVIPTFYMGRKLIYSNEIYSVEYQSFKGKPVGIILGLKNKGMYCVDKERFVNAEEFEEFYLLLNEYLHLSGNHENKDVIKFIAAKQENGFAFFSYIAALLAIVFFFIGTGGGIEYSENINFLLIGANTKSIIENLEIYRIASSIFLHTSIIHLSLNIFMLAIFSELLEKTISFVRITNLFLISSYFAVVSSAFFSSFDASIGASGGIFGLWGGYTFLKTKYEKYLPGSINAISLRKIYLVLLFEIILETFVIENVDYYNHIGGFIAGFAYLYFAPLGPRLELVDQPTSPEKYLFGFLVIFYSIGLSWFLLLYYGLV